MSSVWTEIRRDFPAVTRYVYLNAAAASPVPSPVRAAVEAHYRQFEQDGDTHWEGWLARREEIRAAVARLIGADQDEVAFAPNTSSGINLIVDLLAGEGSVLSDDLEFPTVTLPWLHREVPVNFVAPVNGVLIPDSFRQGVAPPAATIAISHVQFSNGCRQDLDTFGALKGTRRLVVCGSQSTGAFPVDVHRSRVDGFATAGHKWLCAGYGAGFVYMSRELLDRYPPRAIGWMSTEDPYAFDNRHYQLLRSNRRAEMGCPWFGPIFALGAAVEYLLAIGVDAIARRILALNTYLTEGLARAGIRVLSPGGNHRSGETLCAVPDPPRAKAFLQAQGVLVTEKPDGLRISTHFYNNEEDVDRGIAALREYLAQV